MTNAKSDENTPTKVPTINSLFVCLPNCSLDQYTKGSNTAVQIALHPIKYIRRVRGPDIPQACPLALNFITLLIKERTMPENKYAKNISITMSDPLSMKHRIVPSTYPIMLVIKANFLSPFLPCSIIDGNRYFNG